MKLTSHQDDQALLRESDRMVILVEDAIAELVKQFIKANRWDAGIGHSTGAEKHEWDEAVKEAARELRATIDEDVREVAEALMEGSYGPDGNER